MFNKIRFLPSFVFLLILGFSTISKSQEEVDTIVFTNHKRLIINIRKVDFKNDLIKVPIVEKDQEFIYNYLPGDIERITTNDTLYVDMVSKKHNSILYLFTYWKGDKMFFYEHLYNKRNVSEEIKPGEKTKPKQRHSKKDTVAKNQSINLSDSLILQNQIDFKWAIKAGNSIIYNFHASETTSSPYSYTSITTNQTSKSLSFNNYSISLIRTDKWKNIHEFEMGILQYNSTDRIVTETNSTRTIITRGERINSYNFGVAYHYQYIFLKRKKTRFIPFVGFTINPTYQNTHIDPKISTSFPTTTNTIGLNLFVAPGLYYFFSKKVFLSASLPINFFYHNHYILRVENPNVPTRLQMIPSDYSQLFPFTNWYFKISIGFKL